MRVAVLLSGRGSNFKAIYKSIREGTLDAKIACVITNNPKSDGYKYAQDMRVPTFFIEPYGLTREDYDTKLCEKLKACRAELVCLAGYMRILTEPVLSCFSGRIINIHPSLLPSFAGLHAQKQALDYGVKISGCTVHFVDNGVDTGKIIAQRAVEVFDNDTVEILSERILRQEHILYPYIISLFVKELA